MGYKQYCKNYKNIENYAKALADDFVGWEVHHRLETHNSDGERRLVDISAAELKALDMYYNRPSSELIFMKHDEHRSLHKKGNKNMLGKKHSEETLRKISEANKGKQRSEETRNKMSEANKGNTNTKGKHWYNNGKINIMVKDCPDGFVPGMLR